MDQLAISPEILAQVAWLLNGGYKHIGLQEAYRQFLLSRKAMQVTLYTLHFYEETGARFVAWAEGRGATSPSEITTEHIYEYLSQFNKENSTAYSHAKTIKSIVRFWAEESYCAPMKFHMPKIPQLKLPRLTLEQVQTVIAACKKLRDKALVLMAFGSGLRRGELRALDWADMDLDTGLVLVRKGKGRKGRSAVVGQITLDALKEYKKTLKDPTGPLFQSRTHERLSDGGMGTLFRRLMLRTGIHISPHIARRTFALMSTQAGMPLAHLQQLMGHSTPTLTIHYIGALSDDQLLAAHQAHDGLKGIE